MGSGPLVSLTPKGVEEIKTRAFRLNIRRRSILLLLEQPRSSEAIAERSPLAVSDLNAELAALSAEGFVHIAGQAAAAWHPPPVPVASTAGGLVIHDGIVQSEARFLLVNFCVDTFGPGAQPFVTALEECRSTAQFASCTRQISEHVKQRYPQQLAAFVQVVQEVNATAD